MLQWGLLDDLVPRDQLIERAYEIARVYAAKPPVAAQMIKRAVNATGSRLDRAMMHADSDQHLLASTMQDHQRAVSAYRDKTPVTFTGE